MTGQGDRVKDHSIDNPGVLGLTAVVDVFDQGDLFRSLDNDDVLRLSKLGGANGFSDTKAIRKSTGILCRRVLNAGQTPVHLGLAIIQKLEVTLQTTLADFDHVLLCHSHADPNACQQLAADLSRHCGLKRSDIKPFNYGCSGFLKLMSEAAMLLEGREAGARVAMISVETPEYWHDASDRLFCGIVSAAATAAVLEVGRGLELGVIDSDDFKVPADRRPNPRPLFTEETEEVFDFCGQPCRRAVMRMNAEPVFLNGIELMLENLRAALACIAPQPGERIIVAPHQPSGKLLKALVAAAKTEFPDVEFLNNLEHYGNTISCSIPTVISRMDQVLHENNLPAIANGDHVILLAAGICMAQKDDYMSAGHACFQWGDGVLNAEPAELATAGNLLR